MRYFREQHGVHQTLTCYDGIVMAVKPPFSPCKMEVIAEFDSYCCRRIRAIANNRVPTDMGWLGGVTGKWRVVDIEDMQGGHSRFTMKNVGPVEMVQQDDEGPTGWKQCGA